MTTLALVSSAFPDKDRKAFAIGIWIGIAGIGMTSARTRDRLVERLRAHGIRSEAVLNQIRNVPRHLFVDEALASRAYEDTALPIGLGQTISQPYVVAKMTEAILDGGSPEKVLEVGTGSGYQAAVLAEIVKEVYTLEIIPELGLLAKERLRAMGYMNVHAKVSDGYHGWAEHGPFDAIIVTAGGPKVPEPLLEQLADPGVLVIPVGDRGVQDLRKVTKKDGQISEKTIEYVRFVNLIGDHGWKNS